jgi:hypothetical protein
MKKTLLLLLVLAFATATKAQNFGEKITDNNALNPQEFTAKMDKAEAAEGVKVKAEVESVCKAKGCWMKVKLTDGQVMRVTFKDYGFFVPKDIAGKTVVIEGKASTKTTSVADLKHYAEDAGKSKEEIAKINKPEKALSFEAVGVIVQ